ncbi:MAG TPA: hypothetical protein PLO69_14345, partial [Gammaproteobacteria bacterium]|nr:hypothetical protein [Gammaproteobacteria bacterium]
GTLQDGTYAHPYAGIQNAVNAAGPAGTVFVAPGAGAYPGNVTLLPGDTLWGAGYRNLGLGTPAGAPFGPGPQAPVLSASSGTTLVAASGSTLQGLTLSGTNTLLAIADASNVVVRANRFVMPSGFAKTVLVSQQTVATSADFSGNIFQGGGFEVSFGSAGTAPLTLQFDHNIFGGPVAGAPSGFFGLFGGLLRGDSIALSRNTFQTQYAGTYINGMGTVDYGGGPLGSLGQNRFLTYSSFGYAIGGSGNIYAAHNWWGQASGPPASELNGGTISSYHISPWLTADPGP